ncbi:hypothetical protein PRUPE_3G042700 [Prunus persica]|uniref:NAD(P)-binding domain-containing protein n=1 Tax=Prunus persica TaxID=3760 RepID=A0A251PV33_PRUPE|nr:uncharacterized protein LOC18781884 isoform X2 [Prunus persica]ONI15408.1 hypothetical protein PRUPE_3G042700 [Prunus persica]
MAGVLPSSSTLSLLASLNLPYQKPSYSSCFILRTRKRPLVQCKAKKKVSFTDQILDYIEGGPKLRKWYGAPELLPKDGTNVEEDDEFPEGEETRDAVLVTDGDSEMGQMVILSLIVKRARIKALVKDKRAALEAFGTYVEEGFLSTVGSLKGVKHVILLSQLSVYKGANGIQALLKSNARKLAEQDESILVASGIPYTVIRAGLLQNSSGGTQGFSFEQGSSAKGTLGKEDAAFICVEAVDAVPQKGFIFEVINGGEKVSDWKECLNRLMEKSEQQLQ